MKPACQTKPSFRAVRTLVRYVDEDQSVVDTTFSFDGLDLIRSQPVELYFQMTGPKGRQFSYQTSFEVVSESGMVRFEIDHPHRWWPAGMGDQNLYELQVTLLAGDNKLDSWKTTLGMTSVRTSTSSVDRNLLVNGHRYNVHDVLTIDTPDEHNILPIGSDTLLLIRNHFGPNVLYEAADRAGILLIQSVPLSHDNESDVNITQQVDRLAAHPSLAGWMIDRASPVADHMANRILNLDPTHQVFRDLPKKAS